MKPSNWIIMLLAAGCLVVADGCKKQEKPTERKTLGVRVSMSELRQAFKNAPGAEIQAWLSDAAMGLHHGEYTNALAALEKLANHPGLTAQQKKVTSEVISQVKQLAMKYPAR
jgi:hypothetical protein